MSTAITLVRLRWALTLAALRKSVWQTVAYVLSAIFAAGTIIGTGILAWFVGMLPPSTMDSDGYPFNILGPGGIVNMVVVLVGVTITVFIGLIQLMMLGEGSTMSPRKFALYGIADRNLQFGLLLSGLSGLPAITGVISLMLWSLAYRAMGPAVVIAELVAAPLAVITMMSISKMLIALSTTLVTSKRGKSTFYIVIVLLFVVICQLPNILVNSGIAFGLDPSAWSAAAAVMAWTPFGAISARVLIYLKRDPRQVMIFAMPVLFIIIFAFQAHGIHAIVWQSMIWCGWFMSIVESNGLAYDGRGFTMEVIAGVRGWADRLGRVRVYVGIMVVYMALLYVGCVVIVGVTAGRWAQPDDLIIGLFFLAVGLGVGFSGLGVAEITSCVLMYPVASMDKPFSSPQGRAMAQGFFPFVYMLGSMLLMLPTGIAAIVLLVIHAGIAGWLVIIPVALANGIGVLALGTWLGGKLLEARILSIVSTLDSFASLQK